VYKLDQPGRDVNSPPRKSEEPIMMKAKPSIARVFAASILFFLPTPTIPVFAQGTWSTKAPMPVAVQPGVGVVSGILYSVGGFTPTGFGPNSNEAYNPTTDAWTVLAPPPGTSVSPDGGNNVAVVAGIVYMIGGNAQGFCTNANVAYNPVTNLWVVKASMPTPRCGAAVVADNGLIYAIGGTNTSGSIFYSTVEVYDPGSDSWAGAAPMPTPRQGPGATVINGIIYVAGGRNPTNISTLEAYNPSINSWTTGLAPMPTARVAPATGVIGDVMYVVGGVTDIGIVGTNEGYDPSANTWSEFAPMPTARDGPNAGVIGGTMYVLGGATSSSAAITTNEAFSPTVPVIPVMIEIKPPASAPVPVNPNSQGKIPVAILSSSTFNAVTQVDQTSLTFGATGDEASLAFCDASGQDVNGDGLPDLVCHFNTQATGLQTGSSNAVLKGRTVPGAQIEGSEAIVIVPK
jgi:hypothetical protein